MKTYYCIVGESFNGTLNIPELFIGEYEKEVVKRAENYFRKIAKENECTDENIEEALLMMMVGKLI